MSGSQGIYWPARLEHKDHQGHGLHVCCLLSSPLAVLPVIQHLPLEIWPQSLFWLMSTLPLFQLSITSWLRKEVNLKVSSLLLYLRVHLTLLPRLDWSSPYSILALISRWSSCLSPSSAGTQYIKLYIYILKNQAILLQKWRSHSKSHEYGICIDILCVYPECCRSVLTPVSQKFHWLLPPTSVGVFEMCKERNLLTFKKH